MSETIDSYIRNRAKALGMSVTELCGRGKISRQSFYSLAEVPNKLPDLKTIISLAEVLQIHPLRLLHLVFDKVSLHHSVRPPARGDRSAFVADITFPDGALVLPNQTFTKTWEIHNVGKVAWENRFLQCMDEEIVVTTRTGEVLELAHNLIPSAQRVAVPYTKAGDSVRVSVDFTAPKQPMTVLSYWKSVFEDGSLCFPKATGLWCKVRVTALATAAAEDRPVSQP
jgi:transcriptional regulator with XRE-family HTH domain